MKPSLREFADRYPTHPSMGCVPKKTGKLWIDEPNIAPCCECGLTTSLMILRCQYYEGAFLRLVPHHPHVAEDCADSAYLGEHRIYCMKCRIEAPESQYLQRAIANWNNHMTNPTFRLIDRATGLEVGRHRSKKIAIKEFETDFNYRRQVFGQPKLQLRLEVKHPRVGWMEYVARS